MDCFNSMDFLIIDHPHSGHSMPVNLIVQNIILEVFPGTVIKFLRANKKSISINN